MHVILSYRGAKRLHRARPLKMFINYGLIEGRIQNLGIGFVRRSPVGFKDKPR